MALVIYQADTIKMGIKNIVINKSNSGNPIQMLVNPNGSISVLDTFFLGHTHALE